VEKQNKHKVKIAKQLMVILLLVAALSITVTVVIVAIFFDWENRVHTYLLAVTLPLMQTVLALSSYFNIIKTIRNNCFYSALSFFLLPVLWLLWFLWELTEYGKDLSCNNFLDKMLPLLIINAPFFISLALGFLWFRKIIQKEYNEA
jgi:hypothetical protein